VIGVGHGQPLPCPTAVASPTYDVGVLVFRPKPRRVWGFDGSAVGVTALVGLVASATGSLYAFVVAALLTAVAIDSGRLIGRIDRDVVIRRVFRRTRRVRVGMCSFGWRRERFGRTALATSVYIREGSTVINLDSYSLLRPRRAERAAGRLTATLLRDTAD
jgi:hypothetical protein